MKTSTFRVALLTAVLGIGTVGLAAGAFAQQGQGHGWGHSMGGMHGRGGMHMGQGSGPMMHHRMMFMPEQIMDKFDANKDGKITKDELTSALRTQYDKFNTSKDGKLTLAQYEKLWADQMSEGRVRAFQRYKFFR